MLSTWPLTGRAEEISVVTELIHSARFGGIAIAGRAGVGKSRLAREAVSAATASGWAVRQVAATATGRSLPLGTFASWTDDFDGAPLTLARRVIRALTADTPSERLLVLVDDAHLLDDLSALVVHQLVLQQAATVIVTIRSGQLAPDAVTALWKDGLIQRLELQPLSRDESGELLRHALELPPDERCAERMWRLTRGNALYLRQLVEQEQRAGRLVAVRDETRWLGDLEASPSLIEVVEHQIGAMSDAVREVVDLVAVGEPVDWQCLVALVDPAAAEEAERRELIRATGDSVFVGHPMYAEVRLKQCGPLRLRRLRGMVASAMKDGTGPANAVRRGMLWLESDLAHDTQVLKSAAAAACTLLDFDLAARLSRAAEESGLGVEARVDRAYNLVLSQQGEEAKEVIENIAAEEVPESSFINDAILRAANLLWAMRSPEESWRVIDEALETAEGLRAGQLLAYRANQLVLAARPAEVIDMMRTVDYGALDDFGEAVRICSETLALAEVGRVGEALAKAHDGYRVTDSCQQGSFLSETLVEFHSFTLAVAGRIHEAVEVSQRFLDDWTDKPSNARAMAAAIVGATALAAGDLRSAARTLPAESARDDPDMVLFNSFYRFQMLRAQALARLGELDAAEDAIGIAEADWHPTYVQVELNGLLAKTWLAAGRQRVSEARQYGRQAAEFTRAHGQLAREVQCLQTLVQLDDTSVIPRLEELATLVEGPRAQLVARYAQALSADDAPELDLVAGEFESMGDLLAAADASGQAAASHRRAGRAGSAMTSAGRTARLATACGGSISPAIVAAHLTIPFTQREREIAILVAQGLSNRAIAETVSLSTRTVEGHIYRASCKAGVVRRSELADVMRHHGLAGDRATTAAGPF
jgi:DNA-binding CsgD family transcriptional regulator